VGEQSAVLSWHADLSHRVRHTVLIPRHRRRQKRIRGALYVVAIAVGSTG
jgi:hypothetical protein